MVNHVYKNSLPKGQTLLREMPEQERSGLLSQRERWSIVHKLLGALGQFWAIEPQLAYEIHV